MTKIGVISDTHGYVDEAIFEHFKNCNEVWHIGDFGPCPFTANATLSSYVENDDWGNMFKEKINTLTNNNIVCRGVYGNIDGQKIRNIYPEKLFFTCEDVPVFLQHIGGYPKNYSAGVKADILAHKSKLFLSGHSHILKIMYDEALQCLHINPGAAGKQGWHKVRTLVRFDIDGIDIKNCEIIEM